MSTSLGPPGVGSLGSGALTCFRGMPSTSAHTPQQPVEGTILRQQAAAVRQEGCRKVSLRRGLLTAHHGTCTQDCGFSTTHSHTQGNTRDGTAHPFCANTSAGLVPHPNRPGCCHIPCAEAYPLFCTDSRQSTQHTNPPPGHIPHLNRPDYHIQALEWADKYGPIVRFSLGGQHIVSYSVHAVQYSTLLYVQYSVGWLVHCSAVQYMHSTV